MSDFDEDLSEQEDHVAVDYAAILDEHDGDQDIVTGGTVGSEAQEKEPLVNTHKALKTALRLEDQQEWLEWLGSDLVKPIWVELWEGCLKHQPKERGIGIAAVQQRILSGEGNGNTKYSGRVRDKTDWDTADHLACFLWWVKNDNLRSKDGVFYKRNLSDGYMDILVWSLKDFLRHIHAPSYINRKNGGTALFGTKRAMQNNEDENKRITRKRKNNREAEDDAEDSTENPKKKREENTINNSTETGMGLDRSDMVVVDEFQEIDIELSEQITSDKWKDEILKPEEQMILKRSSPVFDKDEVYWKYVLVLEAMKRVERSPMDQGDATLALEESEQANAAIQKNTRKSKKYGPPENTDIFDPKKYDHTAEDFTHGVATEISTGENRSDIMQPTIEGLRRFEAQQLWFDNRDYQRDNHAFACEQLGIRNANTPRLSSMNRSAVLKFWQPVAIWRLKEIHKLGFVQGAILADSVGLGKTWETVAFMLSVWEEFNKEVMACRNEDKDPPIGKPFLVVVPPNLVNQWAAEIQAITDKFTVCVYYGDFRTTSSAQRIEEKLTAFHSIFSGQAKNARAVVLTSYQTLNARHGPMAAKAWCEKTKRTYDPSSASMPPQFPWSLQGLFSVVVFDEAHVLRNPTSYQSRATQWLKPHFHLLLSATPFFNSIGDFKGYMPYLFRNPSIWSSQCLEEHRIENMSKLFALPAGHEAETLMATPEVVEQCVFQTSIPTELAGTRLRRILSMVMVRRTLSSTLPFDGGKMIGSDIPGSQRKQVELEFDEFELETYLAAEIKSRRGLFTRDPRDHTKYRWNMAKLRRLILLSSWLGFIFLEATLTSDHLPNAMRALKSGKIVSIWMKAVEAKSVPKGADVKAFYRTAIESTGQRKTARLEFLLRGSPKMRAMLPILRDEVLLLKEKAIVWTMFPAEQIYVTAVLQEVGFNVVLFHAGLDANEKSRIIHDFTHEPEKCMVLVCSYMVNSAGLNLQTLCRNVHLFSPATSNAVLEQAIGRVCRLGQSRIVLVYNYRVLKTFNIYLISRNRNKAIPGLITLMSSSEFGSSLSQYAEEDTVSSETMDVSRRVIRDGELYQLKLDEETIDSDKTDPDVIISAVMNALDGSKE